jgi:predicted transcriptional regulator
MARPKKNQPTDGELEFLKILWDLGPCELGRICAELRRKRPTATTTAATMLSVMLGKGLVKRSQSTRGYLWSAKVGREATTTRLVDGLLERAFDGSAQLLVAHLIASKQLSEAEQRQVLSLLKQGAVAAARDGSGRKSSPNSSTPESS